MLNEHVRDIMTTNPTTVGPNDTLAHVNEIMVKKRLQQLPVTEDGHLVGLITTFDLWRGKNDSEKIDTRQVKEVMTKGVVKLSPKDKVGTAAELFVDRRFKTLPVVNLRNELKGVVTAFDVIQHVYMKEYPKEFAPG
ncbi:MAG: CBS domain-containing protein [Saprospiraceae bacterium]|jgi:CBS domain-containing protein